MCLSLAHQIHATLSAIVCAGTVSVYANGDVKQIQWIHIVCISSSHTIAAPQSHISCPAQCVLPIHGNRCSVSPPHLCAGPARPARSQCSGARAGWLSMYFVQLRLSNFFLCFCSAFSVRFTIRERARARAHTPRRHCSRTSIEDTRNRAICCGRCCSCTVFYHFGRTSRLKYAVFARVRSAHN